MTLLALFEVALSLLQFLPQPVQLFLQEPAVTSRPRDLSLSAPLLLPELLQPLLEGHTRGGGSWLSRRISGRGHTHSSRDAAIVKPAELRLDSSLHGLGHCRHEAPDLLDRLRREDCRSFEDLRLQGNWGCTACGC